MMCETMDSVAPTDLEDQLDVLEMADYYQLPGLHSAITQLIVSTTLKPDVALLILVCATESSFFGTDLLNETTQYVLENFDSILPTVPVTLTKNMTMQDMEKAYQTLLVGGREFVRFLLDLCECEEEEEEDVVARPEPNIFDFTMYQTQHAVTASSSASSSRQIRHLDTVPSSSSATQPPHPSANPSSAQSSSRPSSTNAQDAARRRMQMFGRKPAYRSGIPALDGAGLDTR
ncbi:hypothetical protein HDV00_003744 [Rhizophlyctis rosea]|nr:hypothetical protein HDV00_003744 [Rhizophlyctis rosea]